MKQNRYIVQIDKIGKQYTGSLYQGNPPKARRLDDLQLGPDVEILIREKPHTLHSLTDKILAGYSFDEREQLEIGHYLYTRLFGNLSHTHHQEEEIELRIVSPDEHIARLPWVLLADRGIFLAAAGWSISISGTAESTDCELPPSPRILVVAPQPADYEDTDADIHLQTLEDRLSAGDHRLSFGSHLQLAETWEEFCRQAKKFEPQVVYFYGHGGGDKDKAALVFATKKKREARRIPAIDFANCLRTLKIPPVLVYVNCCQGDAGGFLGVTQQLESFIAAVVTNRTIANIETVQAQAMAFWENVLLKGIAPHKAVSTLYTRKDDLGLSAADMRWMTPVLHCHYDTWRSNPPKPVNRLEHDPYWHLKIDRVAQFNIVAGQTRQMLRERKPRSLAFVWYGEQGQGIERFHQRLAVELREDLLNTFLYEVQPNWPLELSNCHRAFQNMILEAFAVNHLEDIPARIRSKSYGAFGTQTLVYVRHQPITSAKLINPKRLKDYLEWWNSEFLPLLKGSQFFALLGISFVVKNPPKFRSLIVDTERLEELYLDETILRLLDEMERVAYRDLLDFLRTHNIRLPIKRRDAVLKRILEKTGGHYEQTVEELKHLVDLAWDLSEEDGEAPEQLEEEYDY